MKNIIKTPYVCKLLINQEKTLNMMKKYIYKLLILTFFVMSSVKLSAQVVITYSGDPCEGTTITFFANNPGGTYAWSFGDAGSSASTQENPTFSYPTAGTFTVTLTVTKNGVPQTASVSITVNPKPVVVLALEKQVVQCFIGNKFCFRDSSYSKAGGICKIKYVWSDGTGDEINNPTFPRTICKTFTINAQQTTKYSLTVEITDCNGCIEKKTFTDVAEVLANIGLDFWGNRPRGCDSVLAKFVNKSFVQQSDVKRFIWFFGDGTVDSTSWAAGTDTLKHWYKIQGPNNGNFTTKLYVETFTGCKDTFIYNASASNFIIKPRIFASKDSTCISDPEIEFELRDGPPRATLSGFLWNFGDNLMDRICSGCNYNNTDYPTASRAFGGLGPFQVSLTFIHNVCGTRTIYDTIQIIGPQTISENPPAGILIPRDERYQCLIQDSIHFPNISVFYHNDRNFWNDDSTYDINLGVEIGHKFLPNQKSKALLQNRLKENVYRLWNFDDTYAPQCTTDTRGGKNVGKNCAWSMDSIPVHWYVNWDTIMAYDRIRPMNIGVFNNSTKACSRRQVWYSDSVAIIRYVSPFVGTDSLAQGFYPAGGIYAIRNAMVPRADSLTLDTIPWPFYKPGYHTLVKKEKYDQVQPGDSISKELYRRLFFNTVVRCYQVDLFHKDTIHPLECEHRLPSPLSLALNPPNAKGLRWSGVRCLAPPSPPYGIVFNVSQTKPGCTQDELKFNFDSASGKNNWVAMIGGLFPGSSPPPPPIPVLPYVPQGQFPTSFVYLYTANNYADKKNGWVTVGLIVGNGITTTKPCYDTIFYHRMLRFKFADPKFTIERPLARAQDDKAICRYDTVYFRMNDILQPDVELFSWTFDDGDRITEVKKSYDTAQKMKQYFSQRIANIEKYLSDTADLDGRLSPWAAYQDSVKKGWTVARTFTKLDSFNFHKKLAYPRDSIKKWLDSPNVLIGWLVIERQINNQKVFQKQKGLPVTFTERFFDTFLTSLVTNYKTNTILAPEITPLIINIFTQLGFDYFDIPNDKIADFFGPPGSGRCIDTTGYSSFITFEYEEVDSSGIKILSSRDTNIIRNWRHRYDVAGIVAPLTVTRTRLDGCVQFSSKQLKVGFGKEIVLSDSVLCQGSEIWGLANYWYWSTLDPREITDATDYWRDNTRIVIPKERITRWDWHLGDGFGFNTSSDYAGTGLGFNPPGFNRNRFSGPLPPELRINKNLTSGIKLGDASTIYYKSPGVFELGILAVDSNGCRDTTKQNIYVTKVTAKFAFDQKRPQCKTIVELLDSSFVTDGCKIAGFANCDSIMEWTIDWGDGTQIGGKNNQNRFDRFFHDYTRNGIFEIKLTVKTLLGCVDSFKLIFEIPGPKPFFEPSTLRICVKDSVRFANKSFRPSSSALWIFNFGNGEVESSKDSAKVFVKAYNKPGFYEVYLTQFDSIQGTTKFCPATYPDTTGGQQQKIIIEVVAEDSTNLIADDTIVCKGQVINFANTTRNKGDTTWVSYKWIFDIDNTGGDSVTSPDSFINYAYRNSGVYRVTMVPEYIGTIALPHCPYRDTITIYVDTLKANFTVDTTKSPDMQFNNTSFNSTSYRWWFLYKDSTIARELSDGQPAMSTDKDPKFTYDSLGCYYAVLEATSPDGCKDTTIQLVCNTFRFIIKTYNVFTPGVDGTNDVFDIPIEGHDQYEIVIYNRHGTKVFESNDEKVDWNGKMFNTGPAATSGAYYYALKYREKRGNQEEKRLFGVITLLRP